MLGRSRSFLTALVALCLIGPDLVVAQTDCAPSAESRAVSGAVRWDDGRPVVEAVVRLAGSESERWRNGCGVVTDPFGRYLLRVPTSEVLISFMYLGAWPPSPDTVLLPGTDDLRLDLVLYGRAPEEVEYFDDLHLRPPTPSGTDGIEGCYWMGFDLTRGILRNDSSRFRIFELRDDGTVEPAWRGAAPTWSMPEEGEVLVVFHRSGVSGAMIDIDFSAADDLHLVPARFHLWSDVGVNRPRTYRSFVTRVGCDRSGERVRSGWGENRGMDRPGVPALASVQFRVQAMVPGDDHEEPESTGAGGWGGLRPAPKSAFQSG